MDRYEQCFLDLQVLLAYADGVLAPAERACLSLMSLARPTERDNRRAIDSLSDLIDKRGFDEASRQVIDSIRSALEELPEEKRAGAAQELLRASVATVIADNVLSDKERAFVVDRLAPAIGLPPERAESALRHAERHIDRTRSYVATAWELYLMMIDQSDLAPSLNAGPGQQLDGFLGAVDAVVIQYKLGSSRAVSYFLTALHGVFWVEQPDEPCGGIGRLATHARQLRDKAGLHARLHDVHRELQLLVDRGSDPQAFATVARVLTNALSKLDAMSPDQVALFRDHLGPALDIDPDQLVQVSAQRPSMLQLHRNLTQTAGETMADAADPARWWEFWK